ncbi:MAG TPA: DNA mismatch repair protein MutL, partial [Planctomycetes bacterium]|nr:DNA mismatch repair protein MutL [Planctomycetota bacterium]
RAGGGGAAEAMAARLACHLAVRAGRTLSAGEAGDLLGRADGMEEVDTCPHGRPTKLVLGFAELRKHFDRP